MVHPLKLNLSILQEFLYLKSEEAFNWLRENGHGDLIKNNVIFGIWYETR